MTPAQEREYFEKAAMSNRLIGHHPTNPSMKRFFRKGIEELTSDIRSSFEGLSLVLEYSTFRGVDNGSDNLYLNFQKGFWIVAPISQPENYDEHDEKQELCYQVAIQMKTKLENDKRKGIFYGYEPASFTGTPYLHMDKTFVGYRCTYQYSMPAPPQLNVDEWHNETLAE